MDEFPPKERGRPIFTDITSVSIHRAEVPEAPNEPVVPTHEKLEGSRLREAIRCLQQTREIGEAVDEPPPEEEVLIEVTDRFGDRMFLMFTEHVLLGGQRRRYWSPCLGAIAAL